MLLNQPQCKLGNSCANRIRQWFKDPTHLIPANGQPEDHKDYRVSINSYLQVTNYSLVNFVPLSIKKKEMMMVVKNAVDQVSL